MAFEPYAPTGPKTAHRHGPAKITVYNAANGRTQLSMSSLVRDHLLATEEQEKAEKTQGAPQLHDPVESERRHKALRDREETRRIAVLVDREARRVRMILMYEDAPNAYRPNGLATGQNAYISVFGLGEELGLKDGSVDVELMEPGAIEFDIDSLVTREEAKRIKREASQVEQIQSVLDEGLTTVNGKAVKQ